MVLLSKGQEDSTFEECVERELTTQMHEKRSYGTSEYHYVQKGLYLEQILRFLKVYIYTHTHHIIHIFILSE